MKVKFKDFTIEYDVQYGKGQKILLTMDSIGFVSIKVPQNTSQKAIVDFITQHAEVIKQERKNISKEKDRFRAKAYGNEGKFLYLGKEFFLEDLIETKGLTEDELKINLRKFYILSCKKIVSQRVKIYQEQLKVKPKSVEVDESKIRWGACTSNKKITFNYRLAMAPLESIDYVVVHELCHLLHMNHERSFWRKVGSILPDYKKRQEYLQRYGATMTL